MDAYIEWARNEISEVTSGARPEQMGAAPNGKWSAAQILEHLSLTYSGTAKLFERLLASAEEPQVPTPTLKQRVAILLVTGIGYFPSGREAPERVRPREVYLETIIASTLANLRKMDSMLAQAEARWGDNYRVASHPVLGPLTIRQWRKFHSMHARHHVKQIRERLATS
ncbi:MAG TPA: DUF1569 domain-containing protein [Clostridia bacterium]|nr:DUF1569 domain-containing protein [Clostridia bacterium]